MDAIAMARELGHAIQEMPSYKDMMKLSEECDNNPAIQEMLKEFNRLKEEINKEIMSDERSDEKIAAMDKDLREVYAKVTAEPKMVELAEARNLFSQTFSFISSIISAAANGEDPDAVDMTSCTGSCSTCAGCH